MSILLERAALVSWDYYFKTRGKSGAKNSVSQKRIWELEETVWATQALLSLQLFRKSKTTQN